MGAFNKASITAIVGALLTGAAAIWPGMFTGEVQQAISTVIVTFFVWLVPNK